ncbi:hypothetical protein HAZT_HAZT000651 [Hyalella azteca]|uniref:C2H2-type domain-containing protein n=1 Tax=Hyalella azteca TaxID=294128 RepID=A0A6A0HCK0_HYAAZ|nr:hypothetical protein HAZT_HAZT000651 [Hyalella azteca]
MSASITSPSSAAPSPQTLSMGQASDFSDGNGRNTSNFNRVWLGQDSAGSSVADAATNRRSMRGAGNCDVCGRFFLRSADLKRHLIVHTSDRPFPCRYCDYRARQTGALARHVRIKHFDLVENSRP